MKRLLIPAAIAAIVAIPGVASANAFTADADCDGLTLSMPRTEDGTTVTVTRNGQTVRTVTVDTFGTPVNLEIPSPDRTVVQVWRVTIVGHNGTGSFAETVPACDQPATTVATTVPPAPTPTVAVTTPPVPTPVTVVTPPRFGTTTSLPPTFTLPETGGTHGTELAIALSALAAGFGCLVARRKGGAA